MKHMSKRVLCLTLALFLLVSIIPAGTPVVSAADISVTAEDLQVEYMTTPLGLDVTSPRFSWELSSDGRGIVQESYRIVVAASEANLSEGPYVWDTGVKKGSVTTPQCLRTGLKPLFRY